MAAINLAFGRTPYRCDFLGQRKPQGEKSGPIGLDDIPSSNGVESIRLHTSSMFAGLLQVYPVNQYHLND